MTLEDFWKYSSWVILFMLASLSIAFMPYVSNFYYLALVVLASSVFFQKQNIWNVKMLLLVAACIFSLVLNDTLPIFKSWERLALFAMVLIVASPLVSNKQAMDFRLRLFSWVMWLMVFIAVASSVAYFLGIDLSLNDENKTIVYFGGIARNCMLLAPATGLSLLFLLTILLTKEYPERYRKWCVIGLVFGIIASFITLLVSGSRGAFVATVVGVIYVFYKYNRRHFFRFLSSILFLAVLMTLFYSSWAPYMKALERKQAGNEQVGSITASRDSKWKARYDEFNSSPIFGIGFSSVDKNHKSDYSYNGIVEPGTSWGALLSMVGLLGFVPFFFLYFGVLWSLFKDDRFLYQSGLLGAVMCWFAIHMLVEGYVLAGGSFLCFVLWLTIGAAHAHCAGNIELEESEADDEETL